MNTASRHSTKSPQKAILADSRSVNDASVHAICIPPRRFLQLTEMKVLAHVPRRGLPNKLNETQSKNVCDNLENDEGRGILASTSEVNSEGLSKTRTDMRPYMRSRRSCSPANLRRGEKRSLCHGCNSIESIKQRTADGTTRVADCQSSSLVGTQEQWQDFASPAHRCIL